jgi:hypothetical protein
MMSQSDGTQQWVDAADIDHFICDVVVRTIQGR